MIAKESVKRRLDSESGLSFTEFTYQLLQGFDFAHLHREAGVQVQIGGADQWGNITAGTDLVRKLSTRDQQEEADLVRGGVPFTHSLTLSFSFARARAR